MRYTADRLSSALSLYLILRRPTPRLTDHPRASSIYIHPCPIQFINRSIGVHHSDMGNTIISLQLLTTFNTVLHEAKGRLTRSV
jgi:hypothetical protein